MSEPEMAPKKRGNLAAKNKSGGSTLLDGALSSDGHSLNAAQMEALRENRQELIKNPGREVFTLGGGISWQSEGFAPHNGIGTVVGHLENKPDRDDLILVPMASGKTMVAWVLNTLRPGNYDPPELFWSKIMCCGYAEDLFPGTSFEDQIPEKPKR